MLVKFKDHESEYPVLGVMFHKDKSGIQFYFSQTGDYSDQYPWDWNEVDVIDPAIPAGWLMTERPGTDEVYITYPEWANDQGSSGHPGFYERYLDGSADDLAIMRKHFDAEYEKYEKTPNIVAKQAY